MRIHERKELPASGDDTGSISDAATGIALQSILASAALEENQCTASETILLVEDEAFVRKATAKVLESAGYKVVLACDATQALDRERHCFESIDLLLADVIMPGLNGHDLAVQLVTLNPQVRILLMSGYSEQLTSCEASPHRKAYLAKPFSIPTLLRRVREALNSTTAEFGASA